MGDPDDTVIVRRAPSSEKGRGRLVVGALAGVVLLAAVGAGGYWLAERVTTPTPAPATSVARPVAPIAEVVPEPTAEAIPVASEAAIRAESPAVRTVLRFAENPSVVVIDFPTLAEQGRMFNRVAAWAEKAGVAHDRIPTEEILAAAIVASGVTADTYYYGHDYSAAAIERFFALAAEEHMTLRPEEETLRRLAARATAEKAGFGAVITVVRADEANAVTAQARSTILHHELSHGEYFTNPAYAAFVATVWESMLTAPERAAFRTYLASEGYDPALEDLMRNEMQAYLMHTPDPVFFDPSRLGIPPVRLAQIRQAFLAGMPAGWLRDAVAASGIASGKGPDVPVNPVAIRPVQKPRRRQWAGRVSMGRAVAATVPPRRRRASIAV